MSFAIYPKYENLYEGVTPDLSALISDIPTQSIVNVSSYINALKYMDFQDLKVDIRIFESLIERLDVPTKKILAERTNDFFKDIFNKKQRVTIFPLTTVLKLVNHELINFKQGGNKQLTPSQEENILKAFLILNQTDEEEYLKEARKRKTKGELETFTNWIWPNLLPTMEFQHRKEILLPTYYSIQFFKYLDQTEKFGPYLKEYLNLNKASNWKEYLKKLLEFYLNGYNKPDDRFHFKFDTSILEKNNVISEYILDLSKFDAEVYKTRGLDKNFRQLREKPTIKFADGTFCITNWNFIVDKYYQAQKFDFYNFSGVKELYSGTDNQRFQTFSGEIGLDFVEKHIFIKTMKKYLPKSGGLIVEEDKTKGWNQDLYYRYENHISFIEFKAVLLPVSNRFDEIKKSIDDPGKLRKSVVQLANQIKSFNQNINKFEPLSESYSVSDLIIYPLVVYTDINWSLYGVTQYYNQVLREELKESKLNFWSVEPLIMIHIDFFYQYEKIFLNDKTSLHKVLRAHNMERAIFVEQFKRIPDGGTAMQKYADAVFYLRNVFADKFTNMQESSLFTEMIQELEIKTK